MCGIVGIAGNIIKEDHKAFRDMLLFDTVRGLDSTGVVVVPLVHNMGVRTDKEVGLPDNLFIKDTHKMFDGDGIVNISSKVIIGHNRAATKGAVNEDNAHPFSFGDVHGVHNGSLFSWESLEKDDDGTKFDVDSKAIYKTIADKGPEHLWSKMLGAAALVWWDNKKSRLFMLRNSKRPLYYFFGEKKDKIYWSSEPWMTTIAAARRGIKLHKNDEGKIMQYELEVDHLYEWNATATNCELVSKTKLEPLPTPKQTYDEEYYNNLFYGCGFRNGGGHTEKKEKTTTSRTGTSSRHILNLGWAKKFFKGAKETRGLKINLRYATSNGQRFCGVFSGPAPVDPDNKGRRSTYVEVYPQTPAQQAYLNKLIEESGINGVEFVVKSRMRYRQSTNSDHLVIWACSANDIKYCGPGNIGKKTPSKAEAEIKENKVVNLTPKPVVKDKTTNYDKDDLPAAKYFKSYNGIYIPRTDWERRYTKGAGCACCGNPLQIEDANEIQFLNHDSGVCPDCVSGGVFEKLTKGYSR